MFAVASTGVYTSPGSLCHLIRLQIQRIMLGPLGAYWTIGSWLPGQTIKGSQSFSGRWEGVWALYVCLREGRGLGEGWRVVDGREPYSISWLCLIFFVENIVWLTFPLPPLPLPALLIYWTSTLASFCFIEFYPFNCFAQFTNNGWGLVRYQQEIFQLPWTVWPRHGHLGGRKSGNIIQGMSALHWPLTLFHVSAEKSVQVTEKYISCPPTHRCMCELCLNLWLHAPCPPTYECNNLRPISIQSCKNRSMQSLVACGYSRALKGVNSD